MSDDDKRLARSVKAFHGPGTEVFQLIGWVLKDTADNTYAMTEDDAWTPHRADALRFTSRDDADEELARGEYVHTVRIVRLVKR